MDLSDANILFVTTSTSGGGAERHFCRIAPMLLTGAQARMFVSLIDAEPNWHIDGLSLVTLGWRSSLSYPSAIRSLSQVINGHDIDLVYCFSRCANFVSYCATRLSKRSPLLVLGVNSQPGRAHDLYPTVAGGFWLRMKKLVYPKADLVLCNSHSARIELLQRFGCSSERVGVVRNPVPIADIRLAADRDEVLDRSVPVPYFVTASRLCEGKGLEDILGALRQLRDRIPHNLVVLGEGPMRAKLQEMVKELALDDRVQFPGWAENPYPYYRSARAFLTASYWEGQPNAVLEAMALGTPVVSTVSTSWISHYCDAGACLAVEVGDQSALADAMFRIARSDELCLRISTAATEVIDGYQVDKVTAERDALLLNLIESREL